MCGRKVEVLWWWVWLISVCLIGISAKGNPPILKIKELRYAHKLYAHKEYAEALDLYLTYYQKDSSSPELAYRIGVCMLAQEPIKSRALPYLYKSYRAGVLQSALHLGICYRYEQEIDSSLLYFRKYIKTHSRREVMAAQAVEAVTQLEFYKFTKSLPPTATMVPVDTVVNTKWPEFSPVGDAFGEQLYFTRSHYGQQSIYRTVWSHSPIMAEKVMSSDQRQAVVYVDANATTMLLTMQEIYRHDGQIYISYKKNNNWTAPLELGLHVNSTYDEVGASMSPDAKSLIFSSNRPGGYGGYDLYMSALQPNGVWGKAVNMGPKVNTKGDEISPFLHHDGHTLFYSTNGQALSSGGFDVFKVMIKERKVVSEPFNLGFPINSPSDELDFYMTADGRTGYMGIYRPGTQGNEDIYKLEIAEDTMAMHMVHGWVTVLEPKSTEKISMYIENVNTHRKVQEMAWEAVPVEFRLALHGEVEYRVVIERGNEVRSLLLPVIRSKKSIRHEFEAEF